MARSSQLMSVLLLFGVTCPKTTDGTVKVNCAYNPRQQNNEYIYLPETPSGGDYINGMGYVVGDRGQKGTDGQCLITIEDTSVSNQQAGNEHRIPSSSCSAFAVTPIGNYILYGTAEPYRGIAAYALECRNAHPISEDLLFLPTEYFVRQIQVSNTGTDHQHSNGLVVTLNFNGPPTAFEILTSGDRFRLSPCISIFPHEHASDVALLDRNKVTMLVFSIHNNNPKARPKDRYPPIYLSPYSHRNASLCGYVPVEFTKKVELWVSEGNVVATFVQQKPNSKRSFIRWFTIKVTGKSCKAEPWNRQTVMGASPWGSGFSVLPAGNPARLIPFTIDNILCGVEDIKIVQTSSFTALIVAVANSDNCLENSCTHEDTLVFEEANSHSSVKVCGCAHAIKTSFAILLSSTAKNFALDLSKPSSFQLLKSGPELATEIQTITLPCCTMVQLCSSAGTCELFTVRIDPRTQEFDASRVSGTRLPSMIDSSAVGICRKNTVAVSYSGVQPSSKPNIHKFSCTNFHDRHHVGEDEQPRFHLALQLQNGSGSHIPISDSLPGNRRQSATPFYVQQPPANPGYPWQTPFGPLGDAARPADFPGPPAFNPAAAGPWRFFRNASMVNGPPNFQPKQYLSQRPPERVHVGSEAFIRPSYDSSPSGLRGSPSDSDFLADDFTRRNPRFNTTYQRGS